MEDSLADQKLKNMNKNEDGELQERVDRLENDMKAKEYREGKGKNVDFDKVKKIKEENDVPWEMAHETHIGRLAIEGKDQSYSEGLQDPNLGTKNRQGGMRTDEELEGAAAEAANRLNSSGDNNGCDTATVQQWLDRKFVKNIEERLYLVKLGTNVSDTDVIEREQYSAVGTIHNLAAQNFKPLEVEELYAKEFSKAAARKMESITQKMITDYLTTSVAKWKQMVVTGGTGALANKDAFTSDNTAATKITMENISEAMSRLEDRSVDGFGNAGGKYIGLIHPACAYTLEFDAVGNTEQGMMDLKAGAIGTKFGITFYEYPFAKALASKGKGTPDVYLTFILGEGAFFCLNWDISSTYVTGASNSNPCNLIRKVGVTFTYNCRLHDPDRIVVILSQG